ncbi:hypothetical protein KIN20_008126 [Parelaphostrongylus tenuis]|uniref:Uncharacterized protein n=1 Tax=Parelaphostrongylus tenuis TaxID=148309 RepID=A0AAD5M4B0_PARTN|nr:hypothetical protein KIN20_008126 [Parelaphostrongylus tenuis]
MGETNCEVNDTRIQPSSRTTTCTLSGCVVGRINQLYTQLLVFCELRYGLNEPPSSIQTTTMDDYRETSE